MRRPDFFFVGHPRSGSGRLDGYLQGHPDIFMAPKELHFFGSDLVYNEPPRTLDNYLSQFSGAGEQAAVGEASTWYLASKRAAEEIHDFAPEARILILLRNPVDWLHSLHSHMVFAAYEDITDFKQALGAEEDRLAGQRLPPEWGIPRGGTLYRSLVDYAAQVSRFLDVFGPDQVEVIIFDEFRDAPEETLDRVLRVLGVEVDFPGRDAVLQGSKRSTNSNRVPRSRRLQAWLKKPPRRALLQDLVPPPFPGADLIVRGLRRANIHYTPRQPMSKTLRAELIEEFVPRVEALESLLGCDLGRWKPS
jgi:hypothetical protein